MNDLMTLTPLWIFCPLLATGLEANPILPLLPNSFFSSWRRLFQSLYKGDGQFSFELVRILGQGHGMSSFRNCRFMLVSPSRIFMSSFVCPVRIIQTA